MERRGTTYETHVLQTTPKRELQFTMVHMRQEDNIVNALSRGKADMTAFPRAIRDIRPAIRYQHIDHSEQVGNIPDCECCLHIGLCQAQEKETMREKMALVPIQSFPETWKPKIGAPVIVYTRGVAQQWRVNHIKKGIGTAITIEFEDSEMIVHKSWFTFDTDLGSLWCYSDSASSAIWSSNALQTQLKFGATSLTYRK